MNKDSAPVVTLLTVALMGSAGALAETTEKRVIALKTNDFELAETDVSDLAIGEAETIVTDSGKTIDILRTAEGMEIYVDGELMDMSFGGEHGPHRVEKRMITQCDSAEGDCGDGMTPHSGSHHDGEVHGRLVKKVLVECADDDQGECEKRVWVSDGAHDPHGEFEIEELIESDGDVKIIRIHEQGHEVDFEGEGPHEIHEVIVVREEIEEKS